MPSWPDPVENRKKVRYNSPFNSCVFCHLALSEGVAGVDFVRFTNLTAFQIQLHQSFSLRPRGLTTQKRPRLEF